MSRRTASMTVAAIALATLVAVALLVPMPYVVMSPGVTENTLGEFRGKPVISISGHKTYRTAGQLDLTTVSVSRPDYHPRLPELLEAWWSQDDMVIPRDVIYPPSKSNEEIKQENSQQMLGSQSAAIVAGLAKAGFDALNVEVTAVEDDAPAAGVMQKGDFIESVNGDMVVNADATIKAISGLPPGSPVTLGVTRDGHELTEQLTTEESPQDSSKSRIGVSLAEDFNPPFKVKIELGQDIGGPSAGLMFALAIYDKLTPGKLTGGTHIAGTGEITSAGAVGPIGGVRQKIAGAQRDGATVFLVPKENCDEAVRSQYTDDVELIRVTSINDAVSALDTLRDGNDGAITHCED